MPYSEIRSDAVIATLKTLELRVGERFPSSSLRQVCAEVVSVAGKADERWQEFQRPVYILRALWGVAFLAVLVVTTMLGIWLTHEFPDTTPDGQALYQARNGLALFEGLEPAMNVFVLIGAGLFFMLRSEETYKRRRVLKHIHELRSLVHIIDMHQLTKDPSAILGQIRRTAHSPAREMSRYDLTRYLDYCAELLALIGKIAALYMRDVEDIEVITAANEIEELSTNISRKVWQKITIIGQIEIECENRPE